MENNNNISDKQNMTKQNLKNMTMNEETARYLMNLAQKANLTVTTAAPTLKQNDKKLQTSYNSNAAITLRPNATISRNSAADILTNNAKDQQTQQNVNPFNPFAALPLSLIKSGILSVTSDTACVKIENGVPILKKSLKSSLPETTLTQKNSITIEPVFKLKNANAAQTSSRDPLTTKPTTNNENINKPQSNLTASANNALNFGQFQRKLLLERLKTLMKPNVTALLPQCNLVPNINQMDFAALLGLEIVTDFCQNQRKDNVKTLLPAFCVQCDTDFSPRWHHSSNTLQTYCERCFFVIPKFKKKEQQILHLKKEAIFVHKHFKLPLPKVKLQIPVDGTQQLFKKYLNVLIKTEINYDNNNVGFSELTKLGASIAVNAEVQKALEKLRALHSNATAEMRAKAVQELQIAFYKGIIQGFRDLEFQAQGNLTLRRHQLIVAQMAQKAQKAIWSTSQSAEKAENNTENPVLVFERATCQQQQRLINMIQNMQD